MIIWSCQYMQEQTGEVRKHLRCTHCTLVLVLLNYLCAHLHSSNDRNRVVMVVSKNTLLLKAFAAHFDSFCIFHKLDSEDHKTPRFCTSVIPLGILSRQQGVRKITCLRISFSWRHPNMAKLVVIKALQGFVPLHPVRECGSLPPLERCRRGDLIGTCIAKSCQGHCLWESLCEAEQQPPLQRSQQAPLKCQHLQQLFGCVARALPEDRPCPETRKESGTTVQAVPDLAMTYIRRRVPGNYVYTIHLKNIGNRNE